VATTRDHWSSRIGFILAASGSAIGLGNLWKFPYITWENNGGAFVLVYLICILVVGLPIMITEILIGRRTQRGPVAAIAEVAGRKWSWIGGIGVVGGFVILGYYTVIAGWTLRYFYRCMQWSLSKEGFTGDVGGGFGEFISNGPAQVGLSIAFMILTTIIVMRGISRGIERVTRLLMPILFGILLLLIVSALRLDAAGEALAYIFRPDFSVLEPVGVLEALGHSFFTLSLGMGAMITYGSYLKRDDSVVSSAAIIVVLDTLIALFATVIMFSVILSFDMQASVSGSTAGMLFITLPTLFYEQVPGGAVLAPLFYVLVAFAALTSTISLLEVVVTYFTDSRGWTRRKAVTFCSSSIAALSILCGLSFGASSALSDFSLINNKNGLFAHLDHVASNWILPLGGFFITLTAGWLMTRKETEEELVTARTPRWFSYPVWRFVIRYVAPIAVAAIIVAVITGKDFS